jgi:hypothetical protein
MCVCVFAAAELSLDRNVRVHLVAFFERAAVAASAAGEIKTGTVAIPFDRVIEELALHYAKV